VWARGFDPAIVRDERQSDSLLERGQAISEQCRVRLVLEQPAIAIPFPLRQRRILWSSRLTGRLRQGLVVPPAIELQIANGDSIIAVAPDQLLQCAGISLLAIVVVVVLSTVVCTVSVC